LRKVVLKNTAKLVSIVVPLYNSQEAIKETLNSILKQKYPQFEILLIDDGSVDLTPKIGLEYSRSYANVRYYRKPNGGVASARNFGIREAKGEFIAFCDHDDRWQPLKLANQMPLFDDVEVGLVYSGSIMRHYENGHVLKRNSVYCEGNCFYEMLRHEHSFIPSSSVIVRKSVFDRIGFFEEDRRLKGVDDKHMWLRIAYSYKIIPVKSELVDWIYTGNNWSLNEESMLRSGIFCLQDIMRCFPAKSYFEYKLYQKAFFLTYFHYGKNLYNINEIKKARKCFLRSLQFFRFSFRAYIYFYATFLPIEIIHKIRYIKKILII
jgi:glycosyltransferase involved in cell wall biosynthesis